MKNSFLKIGLIGLIILTFSFVAIGCGGDETANSDAKVYKIGTDAAYPPFEKQEGGEITGFDVDIMKAIADEIGIEIEMVHTGWDPLFEGIKNGIVDAGISAITITEKRKESYDFTEPYFEASQLIMVPKDSNIEKLADLEGKKIGVQSATTGDIVVQETFGETYEGLKGYDDTPTAIDDLLIGRIDAVVADNVVLQEYLKVLNNDEFKLVKDPSFEVENYGIIVKKGNQEMLDLLNEGLEKIKENGKYDEIYSSYFGQ